jgi:hypothetical protein
LSESTTPRFWILFIDLKDLGVYYFINFGIFIAGRGFSWVPGGQKVGTPRPEKREGGLLGHVEYHGVAVGDTAPGASKP